MRLWMDCWLTKKTTKDSEHPLTPSTTLTTLDSHRSWRSTSSPNSDVLLPICIKVSWKWDKIIKLKLIWRYFDRQQPLEAERGTVQKGPFVQGRYGICRRITPTRNCRRTPAMVLGAKCIRLLRCLPVPGSFCPIFLNQHLTNAFY